MKFQIPSHTKRQDPVVPLLHRTFLILFASTFFLT